MDRFSDGPDKPSGTATPRGVIHPLGAVQRSRKTSRKRTVADRTTWRRHVRRARPKCRAIVDAEKAKRGGCLRCPETHPACLDFHHRDPSTKRRIQRLIQEGRSNGLVLELQKCDLICSNCHRKHHYEEKSGPWAVRGTSEATTTRVLPRAIRSQFQYEGADPVHPERAGRRVGLPV